MKLSRHPLSAAFPSMPDGDLADLIADIQAHGQREPGVMHEGMVLDGWHRYQACVELGVDFDCVLLPQDEDPVAYVISRNVHRRNLTAAQRAQAIVACREWLDQGQTTRSAAAAERKTAKQMADEAGVSERTIAQAKTAQLIGVDDLVRDGKISGEDVDTLAKLPKEQRAQAVKDIKAGGEAPKRSRKTAQPNDVEGMQARIDALVEQLTKRDELLREAQADLERYGRILEKDDKVKAALAEVQALKSQVRAADERMAGMMAEKNELVKEVKALRRKLEKGA